MAEGGVALAETVVKTIAENPANYKRFMTMTFLSKKKIEKIVTEIYRGSKVNFEKKAQTQISSNRSKTVGTNCQSVWLKLNTVSPDNPNALGAPENFEITIRELVPKLGAGFIVAPNWRCHDHARPTKTIQQPSTWMLKVMEQF